MGESDVTVLLRSAAGGDRQAYDRLFRAVYDQLRRMAGARMRAERAGHTLQPTALVNEAYLRLVGNDARFEGRAHFFGAAAEAMRRILVEHARQRVAAKRGGQQQQVTFSEVVAGAAEPQTDLLQLNEALEALAGVDRRLADVVLLRCFVGLTIEETAAALETSPATVKRDWTYARAWLQERMDAS